MKVPPSQWAPNGALPGLSWLKSSQQPLIQDVVLRKPRLFLWIIPLPVNQELGTSFSLTYIQDMSNGICRAAVNNGGTRSETGFSTDGRWDAPCGRRQLKVHSRGVHNLIHFKEANEMRSQFTRRRWSKVSEQLHTLAWLTGGPEFCPHCPASGTVEDHKQPNTTRAPYVGLHRGQCHLILLNIYPKGLIP